MGAFFTPGGVALSFTAPTRQDDPASKERRGWGLHWGLSGSLSVEPQAEGELPGRENRLVGDAERWQTDVPRYSRVVYPQVRPGIDLEVDAARHGLKYSLRVSPGATEGSIRLKYEGAQELKVVDHGSAIEAVTGLGVLREDGLNCYQQAGSQTRRVEARYKALGGDEYAIELCDFDPTQEVIVDPLISWSSFLGGSGFDAANRLAIDQVGNMYVSGELDSSDFPTVGAFDPALSGGQDIFVAKINAGGSVAWSTYIGGSGIEHVYGLAVDSGGNVYVAGVTSSGDFPTLNGFDANLSGPGDAFVMKLRPDGTGLVWSTLFGGSGVEEAEAGASGGLAIDAAGNVYVAGITTSPDLPVLGGFDMSHNGSEDVYVAKFDASGAVLLWCSYLGGSGRDNVFGMSLDSGGNILLTGGTLSINFPILAGLGNSPAPPPTMNVFFSKVSASGATLEWSSVFTGVGRGHRIAVDSAGNVYVVGQTDSSGFPVVGGFQTSYGGGSADAFLAKLNPSGTTVLWSTYLGGTGSDTNAVFSVRGDGSIYFGMETSSPNLPTVGPFDMTLSGSHDGFVARIDPVGSSIAWSSYLGGTGAEVITGIRHGSAGKVYAVGYTTSVDFPIVDGFDAIHGGSLDAFVVVLTEPNRPPTANAGPDRTVECTGPSGTSVTLNGTGSTDPDGDTLSYTWTGCFGTATGPTPTVLLPLGVCPITLTVSDGRGGMASDSVVITVVDTTPPTISSVSATPNELFPPDRTMRLVTVAVSATDICDAAPASQIVSVASNEPVTGPGDVTLPDWQIAGSLTVNLRAEFASGVQGRTYTITVRCMDASRNSATRSVTVRVLPSLPPQSP